MNDSIRLLSVPHTGTHFLKELFLINGIENYSHRHYGAVNIFPIMDLIVSPIRDPLKTWISCASDNTDSALRAYDNAWKEFNWHFQNEPDLWVIPVDAPDDVREEQLNLLSMRLGLPLQTDWKPVHSLPHKEVSTPDLSYIYDLPIVQQFYTQQT